MVALLSGRFSARGVASLPGDKELVRVVLDVPSWQYYFSVEARLRAGHCTSADALAWPEAVEQRRQKGAAVHERAVRHELGIRGCDLPVSQSAAMPENALVGDVITSALKAGTASQLKGRAR